MNFHTGKTKGWLKHSSHVMVTSKASRMEEYSRLNSADDRVTRFVDHQDTNIKKGKGAKAVKNTINPKRERELCAVEEFILLSKMTQEVPGRRYEDDAMWKVLDDCTIELISESKKSRADRMVKESQTEEEILLDQFTDALFNNTEATATVTEVDLTKDMDAENDGAGNNNEVTEILDPVMIAAPMDIDADIDDDDEVVNVNVDNVVEESVVKGIGKITKRSPNPLAIHHDIMHYAKAEMEKLNLGVVRVNERERRIRYNNMARDIRKSVMAHRDVGIGNETDAGTKSFMEVSLGRHQEVHITGGRDET